MDDETAGTRTPDIQVVAGNAKARRLARGLTVAEVAERGAISAAWVRELEAAHVSWNRASLVRVALALDTSVARLASQDFDAFEGGANTGASAAPQPEPGVTEMPEDECFARLRLHSVGRVSQGATDEPFVLPVNYALDGGDIVFRTEPGTLPASVRGRVAFEVDEFVRSARLGWSVLVTGDAEAVTDDGERRRLEDTRLASWAGGDRPLWIRIRPDKVTGRRILPHGAPPSSPSSSSAGGDLGARDEG
ncbi:helix-turn-helix domain-containing protein [Yinghuangia aomiensis]